MLFFSSSSPHNHPIITIISWVVSYTEFFIYLPKTSIFVMLANCLTQCQTVPIASFGPPSSEHSYPIVPIYSIAFLPMLECIKMGFYHPFSPSLQYLARVGESRPYLKEHKCMPGWCSQGFLETRLCKLHSLTCMQNRAI